MRIKSLGIKVSLIVAIMIVVIVVVNTFIVSSRSNTLIMDLTEREAASANNAFHKEIQNLQNEAQMIAGVIAYSNSIVNAILERDDAALKSALLYYGSNVDTIMTVDTAGNVLMRMHNDQRGDNVMGQYVVSNTLSTETGMATVAVGATVGMVTRGTAVIKDYSGNVIGAIICGHDLSLPKYTDAVKELTSSECTIFYEETRLSTTLFNENGDRAVGTAADAAIADLVLNQRREYSAQVNLFGKEYQAHYSPLVADGVVLGMLFNGVQIEDALADQRAMMNTVRIVGIICGIVCVIFIFIFNTFAVSRPLKEIGVFAHKIETGELGISSTSVSEIRVRSSDEVGILARSLENAYGNLRGYVGEIQDRMVRLAEGDLSSESTYDFRGDFVLIKDSINRITHNLNSMFGEINASASQVSVGSKQVADGAQSMAQGATEQAASVQEISSSIAEVNVMARDNTKNASEALDEVQQAAQLMGLCMEQMAQMLEAMRTIDEKSATISKTTKVIDDIAFQTNILALNAAVEAARAGQHGKGFAVVAEEVRNLASKSAEAAKETGLMIESSSQSVAEGSRIVGQVNESLQAIAELAQRNAAKITEVHGISVQQGSAMEQINIGIDQVAQVVQQNSATAQESAAASEEMSSQSSLLQELISQFKLKDGVGSSRLSSGTPTRRLAAQQSVGFASPDEEENDLGKY